MLLFLVTFDHQKVYKKEVVQLYLNATISGNGLIKSKVGETEITITVEDIREEFRLPATLDLDVSMHSFNQKLFLDEIKHETTPAFVEFSGKKKVLLKPKWEREIDIIYKCLECKVADVDEIKHEKITILNTIISEYKCD